jgi:hypothetical protein
MAQPPICRRSRTPDMTEIELLWEVQLILKDTYTFPGVRIWLQSRNRNLDMHCPEDLIKSGHHELVLAEARRVAGDGNAT